MSSICILSLLLAIIAVAAGRIKFLRTNVWFSGIFFGFLCVGVNYLGICMDDANVIIGAQNIPAILAAFFFGPTSGIIAGAIASITFVTAVISGIAEPFYGSALSPLVVGLYAAAMKQWVLDEDNPPFIAACITAFFGEILHLALMFLVGYFCDQGARVLEFLSDSFYPILAGAGIAASCTALFFGKWQGWRKNFFSSLTGSLVFLGIVFITIETVSINGAYKQTRSTIVTSTARLCEQFDDQIDYSLHECAENLVGVLGEPEKFSLSYMQSVADAHEVDEVNVFGKDGSLLASNRQAVLDGNSNAAKQADLKEYMRLISGSLDFVKQDFRSSVSEPSMFVKYVGIPFPGRTAFLQLGFSHARLLNEFPTYFFPMFNKTTIGEDGFFMVTDSSGRIVAPVAGHPEAIGRLVTEIGMTEKDLNVPIEGFCEVKLFGTYGCCYHCDNIGEWHFYAFLPYTEFFEDTVLQICVYTLILFVICIAFRLAMVRIAKVQKKIDDMRSADLELAATIQNSELPEEFFENSFCRVMASMTPAKEVGGDFYDHYELPDGRIAVTIADVSGKGIPAAIFMIKAKNILKNLVSGGDDLAFSVGKANSRLNRNNDAMMFVTAWIGIFDPKDGTLSYVSAGHNPPVILRRDGTLEWMNKDRRQKVLAAFPSVAYHCETAHLEAGDRLFLYTDGVTEAMNVKNVLFGNERLEKVLMESGEDLITDVTSALKAFAGKADAADDVTMLTMEVK